MPLAAALDGGRGSLAAVMLDMLDRVDALVAVKEIASGRYVHVNARMAALFARLPAEVLGRSDGELLDANQAAALRVADQAAVSQSGALASEHRIERGDQRREFSVVRRVIAGTAGESPTHLCIVWIELSQARQREAQLQKLLVQLEQQQAANESLRRESHDVAGRDDAMGLYQRTHFDDHLRREADLSAREHRQFSLVSVVLDPLPEHVLALGGEGRARILEALGRLLRSNTRAMDASCRVDEDRFALLLSGVGLATAHARMEGLRRQCATQIVALQGRELGFTVAMGVASFPHTAATQEALCAAADAALAEAIRRGGNHVALAGIRFEAD
ncbi:MAG: diguanylate cyclase [Methylibium sp. NZG]|nr:MAG: diguanylate cyclase [Methylibium sp. NZG]KNZ34447.1 MAG: diguanylate cyclase [Methylibium sp. NZG]